MVLLSPPLTHKAVKTGGVALNYPGTQARHTLAAQWLGMQLSHLNTRKSDNGLSGTLPLPHRLQRASGRIYSSVASFRWPCILAVQKRLPIANRYNIL